MTPQQLAAIKAYIEADQFLNSQSYDGDGLCVIRDALNAPASPAFIVWKTKVSRREILQNGFDWTRLDNLSVGKARIWSDIFVDGTFDASKPNVRTGIEAVWVGTAADLAVRAAVYVHCKRHASVLEKILATGTGSEAVPAVMGYEGTIDTNEVDTARRS